MDIAILGDGGLGRVVAAACLAEGHAARVIGRPASGRHDPAALAGADVVLEASRAGAVVANLEATLDAGCRRVIVATTGWGADRPVVEALLREAGAAAVTASNFSIGVVLFGRLVEVAVDLFGPVAAFDPYLVEWHRRTKTDRPSGTAEDLANRILARHPGKTRTVDATAGGPPEADELEVVSVRAGASPGMHLVGFDAPGETIELRLTSRDRWAFAAGILLAADWLVSVDRPVGLHGFDPIVDEMLVANVTASRGGAPVAA